MRHEFGATSDSPRHEHNDCAVIALANVTGLSYFECHARLQLEGRRTGHSTKFSMSVCALNKLKTDGVLSEIGKINTFGIHIATRSKTQIDSFLKSCGGAQLSDFSFKSYKPTVAQFLRTLPTTGRFYLASSTHAFAYVNGVLMDNIDGGKMRARMARCVEVKLAENVKTITNQDMKELWARLDKLESKLEGKLEGKL